MDRAGRIEEIIRQLEIARDHSLDPALSAVIASGIAAVRTSTRRALCGERHLSTAARVSIASGALYGVMSASRRDEIVPEVAEALRMVAVLADEMSDGPCPESSPVPAEAPPAGWGIAPTGEFARKFADGRLMRILRRPSTRGAEWRLFWRAAPIGSASTPADAAELAERIDRFLSSQPNEIADRVPALA